MPPGHKARKRSPVSAGGRLRPHFDTMHCDCFEMTGDRCCFCGARADRYAIWCHGQGMCRCA